MMHITITARIRWSDGSHFSSSAKLELNYKHNEGTSSEIWGLFDATLPQQIADVWHAFSTVAHRVHISGHTEAGERRKKDQEERERKRGTSRVDFTDSVQVSFLRRGARFAVAMTTHPTCNEWHRERERENSASEREKERSEVKWSRSAVESVVESALGSTERERMRMERGARRSLRERERKRERETHTHTQRLEEKDLNTH